MEKGRKFCEKAKYASQNAADEAIARFKKQGKRAGVVLRSYLCVYCSTWHLTSKPDFYQSDKMLLQRITQLEHELKSLKNQKSPEFYQRMAERKTKRIKQLRLDVSNLITQIMVLKRKYGEE